MTMPTFLPPTPVEEDPRCRSLRATTLHKDGGHTVYLRCEATAGHPGKNHRSWMRKWTTEEEDGRLS